MRDRIAENAGPGFDSSKIAIIHNWEDGSFIEPRSKSNNWFAQEHGVDETFTLLYSGNIGENHDLETVVEAATHLDDEDVVFLIIGEGDKKATIVEMAEERGLRSSSIRFLPYQDFEDLPYSLTAGDISIITVQEGMEGICVSSKLYTALAAGMPVLVISQPNDDEARIVDAFGAGFQAAQGDPAAVVDAVHTWIENPSLVEEQGRRARESFEAYFTVDKSIDRYYALLADSETLEEDPAVRRSGDPNRGP
jgi:glycosyltransferase involved in cell wall biosynthesis